MSINRMLCAALLCTLSCSWVGAAIPPTPASAGSQPDGIAPKEPRLEFVFESKTKLGEFKMTGVYNGLKRGTLQLLGGSFAGPNIQGSVLPSTRDWPVYFGNGVRLTDVSYCFVTNDGAQLFVSVEGYRYDPAEMKGALLDAEKVMPAPNLLRTIIRIQAPDDSRYSWMNYNLFVGVAGTATATAGSAEKIATLRVYRIL